MPNSGISAAGAILTRTAHTDAQGRRHLITPIARFGMPIDGRQAVASGQYAAIQTTVDAVATLVLIGGRSGQRFTLQWTFIPPQEERRLDLSSGITSFTWPAGEWAWRVDIDLHIDLKLRRSGLYHLRFLIDGEPLLELPLHIRWEDERAP